MTKTYASVFTDALLVLVGVFPEDILVRRRAIRYYAKKGELDAIPDVNITSQYPHRQVEDYILSQWQER